MNRRDFAKTCASAALAGVVLNRPAFAEAGKPAAGTGFQKQGAAYVRTEGMTWVMGTSKAERTIALRNGGLVLTSLRNKLTGREYRDAGPDPAEIRLRVDGKDLSSPAPEWTFVERA